MHHSEDTTKQDNFNSNQSNQYECLTSYNKIRSNCKVGSFYCWASEDGLKEQKHVRPYKELDYLQ
jgi:hypothetical protein